MMQERHIRRTKEFFLKFYQNGRALKRSLLNQCNAETLTDGLVMGLSLPLIIYAMAASYHYALVRTICKADLHPHDASVIVLS